MEIYGVPNGPSFDFLVHLARKLWADQGVIPHPQEMTVFKVVSNGSVQSGHGEKLYD